MSNSRIRKRLTFSNVVAVLALFVALGGASYAATKINGKSIKKGTIAGTKLKPETIDGSRVDESKLGEVPNALRAASAGAADSAATAATADHATTAGQAETAGSASTATSAATAENAQALGGQSAAQLRAGAQTAVGNAVCNPNAANINTQNVSCVSLAINLPVTSDVVVIGSGGWYGQGPAPTRASASSPATRSRTPRPVECGWRSARSMPSTRTSTPPVRWSRTPR
jgi:hypothetical protein